uniref:Aspartyl/glutamyl-tRNA(Asn/Gln) amidotransferase subunit C n=1 Tax=Magnetococcus massalia (strain MO-1) TaxID=451514 RepID=A0A1S7LNT0_MAGMO|nr:Aspartyl/glutamyl-tRNA(Asn/Gln) amidotransferase subunit C [Candidatus Magnetococcus massalia]
MSIDKDTVKHVANLARLEFNEEELDQFTGELSKILDFMQQLDELDTSDVEPLSHIMDVTLPQREDVVTNGNQRDAMLANAPEAAEGHFCVPKVIE